MKYCVLLSSVVVGIVGASAVERTDLSAPSKLLHEHARRTLKNNDVTVDDSSAGLCGASAVVSSGGANSCASPSSVFGVVDWPPCCSLDIRSKPDSSKCRVYNAGSAYCSEDRGQNCDVELSDQDVMSLSFNFDKLAADHECCKSCVCFGDPECVSFENVEDLWIPCDARDDPANTNAKTDCRVYKSICDKLKDPNGNDCIWKRDNHHSSYGWDIGKDGSPCVPDIAAENITMNMYTSKDKKFVLDLYLGERGIIRMIELLIDSKTYFLDAARCFDENISGTDAWVSSHVIPSTFSKLSTGVSEIGWQVIDNDSDTSIFLLCARAGNAGIPRINVQSLTVLTSDAAKGSGFCVKGTIDEASNTQNSVTTMARHHACVATDESALQACKFLMYSGAVDNQLGHCAQSYCTDAAIDRDTCIKELGDGGNNNKWVKQYCAAIVPIHAGTELELDEETCKSLTTGSGWPSMVGTYGKGIIPESQAQEEECVTDFMDYAIENKKECAQGVYIEVNVNGINDATEDWVPKFFIPVLRPPCDATVLSVTGAQAPVLFKHPVRFRQCDLETEEACASLVATCSKTVGASFELSFVNSNAVLEETLRNLYLNGQIKCADVAEGQSDLHCVEQAGAASTTNWCPCPAL